MPLLLTLACWSGLRSRQQQQQGEGFQECLPRPIPLNRSKAMGRNWVTAYMNGGNRPSHYEPTPQHWRELEARLQCWGGVSSWKRLEQLGTIARTDQTD